ncbi:hypothetical protein, partial [Methanosarcina horonobensis]|uniref:hypothetical protein n=1 Tax=Methanosarcina horonobensis TaxID=418008 RepID=UPI0022B911DC
GCRPAKVKVRTQRQNKTHPEIKLSWNTQGTKIYLIKEPSSQKVQNLFDRRSEMKTSRLRLFSIYLTFIF